MKVMSIIGIIWFSFFFIVILACLGTDDDEAAAGAGFFAILYGIPYSITCLVHTSKKSKKPINDAASEIMRFKQLCDDGVITQEEFETKKNQLL